MAKTLKQTINLKSLSPAWLFGLALLLLILAYIVTSRALDTGSWWEYSYAFVLTIFALNCFSTAISRLRNKKS